MIIPDRVVVKKLGIKSTDRVLDVGGSMMQHTGIDVDTIADIIPPEEAPYNPSKLLAKHFVKVDITREKLPFKNKEFDVVLCTHTLEDLPTPFPIIEEMERVGKKGLIETPTMGFDMTFGPVDFTDWLSGARRMPGEAHHKWFFINEGPKLKILPKIYPILYTPEFQITGWKGNREMVYFWKDKIEFEEIKSLNMHSIIDEYKRFTDKYRKFIKKGRPVFIVDNLYNWTKAYFKLIIKRGSGYKYRKTI